MNFFEIFTFFKKSLSRSETINRYVKHIFVILDHSTTFSQGWHRARTLFVWAGARFPRYDGYILKQNPWESRFRQRWWSDARLWSGGRLNSYKLLFQHIKSRRKHPFQHNIPSLRLRNVLKKS